MAIDGTTSSERDEMTRSLDDLISLINRVGISVLSPWILFSEVYIADLLLNASVTE